MVRKANLDELAAQEIALLGAGLRRTRERHADVLSPSAKNWIAQVATVLDDIAASTTTLHEGPVLQWVDSFVIDGVILDNADPQRQILEADRRRLVVALNDDDRRHDTPTATDADGLADRMLGVLRRTNWRDLPHQEVIAQAKIAALLVLGQLELLAEQDGWTDADPADLTPDVKHHENPEPTPAPTPALRSIRPV